MKRRSKERYTQIHVSIPVRLLEDFDDLLAHGASRSKAIAYLIRESMEGKGTIIANATTKQLFAAIHNREDVDMLMKSLILQVLSQ